MATQQEIYTGFWMNHAEGRVVGQTLTLTAQNGAYLIALLALFVHLTGACFWRLISYAIFQTRARPELHDPIKLQEQIVLRNSPTSISALRNLFFVRVRGRGDLRKSTTALMRVAALNFIGFFAAGILSSKVTSISSDVLLNPTHCGRWWDYDFTSVLGTYGHLWGPVDEVNQWRSSDAVSTLRHTSSQYATVCYESANPPEECVSFGRRAPQWNSSMQPGCPFGDDICEGGMSFTIDSGYIDSCLDLGINAPVKDRLSLRLVKECAPLAQHGYMETYDRTNITEIFKLGLEGLSPSAEESVAMAFYNDWAEHSYDAFFYGQSASNGFTNATFIWNNGMLDFNIASLGSDPALTLYQDVYAQCQNYEAFGDTLSYTIPNCGSTFEPIPALKKDGYNTVFLYLASKAKFLKPVADPWFCTDVEAERAEQPYYYREHQTRALACAEKTELCNTNTDGAPQCIQLNSHGWPLNSTELAPANVTTLLGLTERQTAIAHRLQDASFRGDFTSMVGDLGAQSMLAYPLISGRLYYSNIAAGLPDDQWTREIEHWFATQLITMQAWTTEFVTGYQNAELNEFITPPDEADTWMCSSQIIQRRDFSSFSILGISIILGLGGFIVVLNMCITWLVNRVRSRTPLQMYKKGSWKANDLLELQAFAAEPIHRKAESYTLAVKDEKKDVEASLDESKAVTA